MRQIKFRIWDLKRKEWVHDTSNAVNLLGETIILGEILRRPDDSMVRIEELNELVVMQFTGLKDKNGKEIYDGDILLDVTKEIRVIDWEEGSLTPFGLEYYEDLEDFKIIGNIYENPDLIK